MAPSPELGQPKAPDKTDTTATGTTVTGGKSEDKTDSGDKHESIKETDFSSTTTTTTTTNTMTTTTTTKQQDSENLSNLDERALEALLKEAITYKTPRDREHKSEMFRELLQDAEKENQKSDFSSYDLRYRKHKGSSRHTQGGSLQDLAETDNLDDIFGHNKKHYNLKHRHSSVSSRQREGGSLPSNVNVPFQNLMSFDTSCMFDVNLKKKCKNSGLHSMKQQQQQQLNSKDESQLYDSKIVGDTVIEIGDDESDDNQTNIPYEPLQEELSEPINPDVDYLDVNPSLCQKLPRIQTQRQYTSQAKIEISETSPPRLINQSNTDKTVSFSLLENSSNKNNVDMTPVQLNPSYNSVESIVGNKSAELNSRPTISANKFISANIFPQKLDVGDNSVQPFNASLPTSSQPNKLKYKKVPKSDRNTITVDYTKKEGFRGNDTINDLVRYIEAENETEKRRKENTSNNNGNSNSNNINSNNPSNNNHNNNGAVLNSNNSNKKSKNNNNNSKKDSSSKLKKCNSLEELSSCSKLKELKESSNNSNTSSSSSSASSSSASSTTSQNQIQAEAVTLRTKSNTTKSKQNSDPIANIVITNSITPSATTITNSNNNSNNKKLVLIKKRSERRSWGTEELNYLGDSKVNSDYIKNNELLKNNSDDVNNNDDHVSLVNNSGSNNVNSFESNELISSHVNSMDASEFLLVTKKKKPKKIKLENNNNVNNNNNNNKNSGNNNNRGTNNRSKYNHNNNSHMIHNAVTNQNNHHPHHNDRDLYLNSFNSADNNRRKSTSSVPPSERSDSSDLDSVHSLPVESIKSIQISPTTVSPPANATKQSPNQISYADIAKIPNKQNPYVSTNNIDMLNNNMDMISTTPTTTATTTENLLTKQLLYSKSLNEIKTPPNQLTLQPQQPNGIIMSQIQNKNQFLLKSKSVDNDNYNVSIDQYPALEKTIKKNSNNTNSIYISNAIIDNRMIKTSKKSPILQSFVTTTISTPKKMIIDPIEVSQIEKCIVDELYNNKQQQQHPPPPPPIINNNKPAALKQVVVNNNNNANINKLNEFTVAPAVEILPIIVTPAPVMPVASISSTSTSKRPKKDKSNPTSVILKNNINNNSCSSSNSNRPAVIILNDMDRDKPGNDITFGFEINQKLLFGDFNEEEMKLFETGAPQHNTITTTNINATNNSDVSDYFSISDTSLELSGTMTMINNASVSNSSNNNSKLNDTDNNQCDIINSVEQQDVDKMNNSMINNNNNLDNNNSLDKNENFKKIREIDITKINFKAPNLNDIILTEHNHDKIVNFIESAWEDIISGTNGGAKYYNGQ